MKSFFKALFLFAVLIPTSAHAQDEEIWDPLEPMNRGVFWFNDKFDIYFMEPLARGYKNVLPDPVETSITHFFENIRYPLYLVSDILQFKFDQALYHTTRFLVNTTVGVGGLFDVATGQDLPARYEDIGIAFGRWGINSGPYLVIPFIGPSNLRDFTGKVGESFVLPMNYIQYGQSSYSTKMLVEGSLHGLDALETRARLLQAVEAAKESSLDYYLFVQSAYYQVRGNQIHGSDDEGNVPEEMYDAGDEAP